MTAIDWGVTGTVLSSVILVVLPWVMKVHAKLAVAFVQLQHIEQQLAEAGAKLDRLMELYHDLASRQACWDARLEPLHACAEQPDGEIS